MATIDLGTYNWGSAPSVSINFSYEKRRIGADMQYWIWVWIYPFSGSSYFGYPIYLDMYIGGQLVTSTTLKNAYPSRWATAISYQSPWVTIPNKTTGTTPASCRIYSGLGSSRDQTYNFNLPIDPAASSITVNNGTLGVAQNITVSRQNTAFTHTITYNCGSAKGDICVKSSATTVSWTPPIDLARQSTMSTSAKATITCITYSGGTEVGRNSKEISLAIPESIKPSVSMTITDPEKMTDKYGDYVKGKSKIKVALSISHQYGASTSRRVVIIDGKSYAGETVETDYLKNAGVIKIEASIADSRGREAYASTTKKVLDYSPPKILSLTAKRCNINGESHSTGEYLRVDFSTEITALNNKNTALYKLFYRERGLTTWTSVSLNAYSGIYKVTGGRHIFRANTSKSYDIKLQISDDFGPIEKETPGSSIKSIFSFMKRGLGVAFGKVAELEDTMEVDYVSQFNKTSNFDSDVFVKGKIDVSGNIVDKFGTIVGNGLVKYLSSGIDPDTTLEHAILTHIKTPLGTGVYMYIITYFYGAKSETANRMQLAFSYDGSGSVWRRCYYNKVWSDWDGDTDWVSIAEQPNGESPAFVRYRKKSGYVTVTGSSFGQWTVGPNNYRSFLTKLPEGCRPDFEIVSAGVSRSTSGYEFQIHVLADGTIKIFNSHPSNTWGYWGFHITFPV